MRAFGIFVIILDLIAATANAIDWWVKGGMQSLIIAGLLVTLAMQISSQVAR